MAKKKPMCIGYILALRHATKHKRKVIREMDIEDRKADQMNLFKDNENV